MTCHALERGKPGTTAQTARVGTTPAFLFSNKASEQVREKEPEGGLPYGLVIGMSQSSGLAASGRRDLTGGAGAAECTMGRRAVLRFMRLRNQADVRGVAGWPHGRCPPPIIRQEDETCFETAGSCSLA